MPDKNIIKSVAQRLKEAEFKIGELERMKERLQNSTAYLLVGIQALGKKLDYSPEQAKACIDQFILDREVEEHEKIKEEYKAKIAKGEAPNFKIIDQRGEAPANG